MRRSLVALVASAVLVAGAAPSRAGQEATDTPVEPVDQAIHERYQVWNWEVIDAACTADPDRPGERRGPTDTARIDCLETVLLDQVEAMLDPEIMSRARAEELLRSLRLSLAVLIPVTGMEGRDLTCRDVGCASIPGDSWETTYMQALEDMVEGILGERIWEGTRAERMQAPAGNR